MAYPGNPEAVYIGLRDNMIAEVSAWDPRQIGISPRQCKYLVKVIGEADFDTEWFSTWAGALKTAKEASRILSIPVRSV